MRIAQVMSAPPQAWQTGGIARVGYELSKELAERGEEVDLLTTDAYKPDSRYPKGLETNHESNLDIMRHKNINNYLASKYHGYASPGLIRKFRNDIKKYDIIHCHDVISVHSRPLVHFCNKYDVPVVVTLHGSLPWMDENRVIGQLSKKFIAKPVLSGADRVIALNESECRQAKKAGVEKNKLEIIPNGINKDKFSRIPRKGSFKEKYGIEQSTDIVLYIGRLHESKGLCMLIDSFNEYIQTNTNSKLVFVGPDDRYRKALDEKIEKKGLQDKTLFTGFVDEEEKIGAYMDSKVLVTPNFDGFPMTFVEACMYGTPVITTDKGDKLEWIEGNVGRVTGWDKKQLSNAIKEVCCNEEAYKRYSKNAKRIVRNRFNWEEIALETVKLYQNVLEEPAV